MRPWSFSALLDYEECPYRVWLRETGAPKPPREENRGEIIHKAAEDYVSGKRDDMIKELQRFSEQFEHERELFANGLAVVEGEWGFTLDLQPTGFYADDVWLRVKADLIILEHTDDGVIKVVDHKTGKSYMNEVKHISQGQLYAIGTRLKYPEIGAVDVEIRYLDEGKSKNKVYHPGPKFDRITERWMERAVKMGQDKELKPKPHRMRCRFCKYGPNESGSDACEYGVPWE